jgi:hypothetical protein
LFACERLGDVLAERDVQVLVLDDLELVWRLYGLVLDVVDDDLHGELVSHLSEAVERFAPAIERAKLEREAAESFDNPAEREQELAEWLEGLEERAAARLLLRG